MDILSPQKKHGVRTPIAKIQWQSRVPWWLCNRRHGDIATDDTGAHAVYKACRRPKWLPQKWWDVVARLPDCDGQAADAVSAYTQLELEDTHRLLKIRKSGCPDIWIRLPRHRWPTSWANIEDPVVPLERNPCGYPLAGLWWERQFEDMFLELGWWKSTIFGVSVCASNRRLFFIGARGWHKHARKEAEYGSHVEKDRWKNVDLDEPTSFLDHVFLGCAQRECKPNDAIIEECTTMFESRISLGATEKLLGRKKPHAKTVAWSCDMEGLARKYIEPYCELANKTVEQFFKVSSPSRDDHQVKQEERESVGDLSQVCSQIILKCLYVARIGRPDILWSVKKLARAVTKWTQACDRRLAIVKCGLRTDQDTFFSRCVSVVHFWRQRSCHQDDYLREEVPPWDTCPEPTELRLIGCSTKLNWNPRSKSNMLTPKTNLLIF